MAWEKYPRNILDAPKVKFSVIPNAIFKDKSAIEHRPAHFAK
jgi:hypothetical protein